MSQDPNEPQKDEQDQEPDTDQQSEEEESTLSDEELSEASGGMRPSFAREASPIRVS